MLLIAKNVEYLGDYILIRVFSDGVANWADLELLLKFSVIWKLRGKNQFVQSGFGEIASWTHGADIALKYLYGLGVAEV